MPNYLYLDLKREFYQYIKKNKNKGTLSVWEFCRMHDIGERTENGLPARNTIYKWYRESQKRPR